ncbi:hypothetical protein DM860_005031 [Cuscuta australis]|uniref:Homeobox domain-containing protein n=1 Tax=Cuscuta australis TaxID=267555 RepID=A0A328DM72_9ASTE|nr:hypothetical protein DM860_005031 [Cuscuta australis]
MSGDYFSISQSDVTQHVRREKLRVQGFDLAPPFQEQEDEGEHHRRQQAAYETTGMLSEMFDFSPAELLETCRIRPPEWFPGRQEMVTGGGGNCRPQHVSGVNAEAVADMKLFLMNPPPPADLQGYDHPAQPGGHFGHFTNAPPGIGGANVVEGRGLSLSLSSSLHNLEAAEEFREHGGMLVFSQGSGGWGGGGHHHTGLHDQPAGVGVVNALRNSKYAKAARELLEEFCGSVGQRGQFTTTGELITPSADQNPTSNNNTPSMSRPPLSSSDRIEHRRRKVKLLSMLDEADKKYGHYCDQMRMVANSFDSIMGIGASKTYTSPTHRAMSRHFRCLKDAIAAQLKHSLELLGEKDDDDDDSASVSKGETPRLKILEWSSRQQRAALLHHQMGQQEEGCWRPQRGLPERSVNILRSWLFQHFLHPYPSDAHKKILARQTGLSRSQVSNWFINARVRLWKPMVEDMYQQEAKEEGEKSTGSSPNTSAGNHPNNYDDNANTAPPPPPAIEAVAPPSSAVVTTEMDDGKRCEMNNNDQDSGDPSPLLDFGAAGHIIGWSVVAGDISLTLGLRHHGNLPGKNAWS